MIELLHQTRQPSDEATDRALVTVVFLRMDAPRMSVPPVLPDGVTLAVERCNVTAYRALYDEVGAPWLWWLRRVMPDQQLAQHLASQRVSVYVLRVGQKAVGFFETESSNWPDINLNYFGLLPDMIGQGLGRLMLDAAIASVFPGAPGLRGMTVNTCSADHPRALPNYLAAGFAEVRRVREVWDIPRRLGLQVPAHLHG